MVKKIIIIGAGIGGLSAGCYAQMNGFDSEIFEMHSLPGGQCTAWKRGGYIFDGCIHHFAGAQPWDPLYKMWTELGALPARKILYPEDMCQVEDETGKRFTVYVDLEHLKQEMQEIAPEDQQAIDDYIKACKVFEKLDVLDMPLLSGAEFSKRFLKMATIMKWQIPMSKYAQKFKNPYLRKVFPTVQYDWTENPTFVHLNMMGNCSSKNYGVPEGGSLEFSRAIEQRYRKLGGAVNYGKRVDKILVENGAAVGIRLVDGSEHRVDIVISNGYAYQTVYGLLGGAFVDDKVKAQFAKPKDTVVMGIHVSFGLKRDLSKEPRALVLFLEKPTRIADEERTKLDLELFGYDPTLAPAGKSVIKVLIETRYSYWTELHKDQQKYGVEKKKVAEIVLQLLEKRFPGITGQVEVTDVATPVTTERYTGVGQPFDFSWGFIGALSYIRSKPRMLPGLRSFYMVGGAAGLPGCAGQGRSTIQDICKKEKTTFKTSDA